MALKDLPTPDKEHSGSYHHGDLRNALIDAGLEILAKEGNKALSLREVARRAGVSHAAPYRHFADKEALVAAIAQDGHQKLARGMREAAALFPEAPCRQLIQTGKAYVQFALDNPGHLRVMFRECEHYPFDAPDTFGLLVDIIRNGQAAGSITSGDPEQLALTTWSTVHGLAFLLIEESSHIPKGKLQADTAVEACIHTLLDGLGTRRDAVDPGG